MWQNVPIILRKTLVRNEEEETTPTQATADRRHDGWETKIMVRYTTSTQSCVGGNKESKNGKGMKHEDRTDGFDDDL